MARIPWLSLLLTAWLFTSAFGADAQCDSDGIIGTFGQEDDNDKLIVTSMTITPVLFDKDLEVGIIKDANGDDTDSGSIQVYLTLDSKSQCTGTIKDLGFTIVNGGNECKFEYDWTIEDGSSKITPKLPANAPAVTVDVNAVFQASFEVLSDYTMMFNDPTGNKLEIKKGGHCFDVKNKNATFTFKVASPATQDGTQKGKECGVQYEMKGKYNPTGLKHDGKTCTFEDPGSSNQDGEIQTPHSGAPVGPTTSSAPDEGFVWWWILLIVLGAIVLLLVIGLLLFFLVFKKKKNPEGDPEAEPQMPDNPDDGAATAEEIPDTEAAQEKGDESAAGEQAPPVDESKGGEPSNQPEDSKNADQPEGSKKADQPEGSQKADQPEGSKKDDQPEGSKKADDASHNDSAAGGDE